MQCDKCLVVKENLSKCGKCQNVFYCSKECQVGHWSLHKQACRIFDMDSDRLGMEMMGVYDNYRACDYFPLALQTVASTFDFKKEDKLILYINHSFIDEKPFKDLDTHFRFMPMSEIDTLFENHDDLNMRKLYRNNKSNPGKILVIMEARLTVNKSKYVFFSEFPPL